MDRSDRPIEKQAVRENEAHNNRSDNSVPNTVTLDNDTMVEVLKHLNYCQLASSSLVSKRYHGVIQKNRHKLALLKVSYIAMRFIPNASPHIKMFGEYLSPEAYNEWVIHNHYSKQVPFEGQIDEMQSMKFCHLWAYADYQDPNNSGSTSVFDTNAEFSHEHGPLFQHFVRLVTDPFIYIDDLELVTQIDVLILFAGAIKPDRLKCNCLSLISDVDAQYLRDNTPKIIMWMKDHVLCNELYIRDDNVSNYGKELINLFMTGGNYTSDILTGIYDLCKVVVVIVQKFIELKSCDENQLVESMRGSVMHRSVEGMKRYFAKLAAKEGEDHHSNTHILEFVNKDIGKKLELTTENNIHYVHRLSNFSIKINNL